MKVKKHNGRAALLAVSFVLSLGGTGDKAEARVNVVSTSVGLGIEYLDQDRTAGNGDYYFRHRLTPGFYYTSEAERDQLKLSLLPSIRYDHYSDDTDFDLAFGVDGLRFLSERWQVGFSEKFTLTDTAGYSGEDPAEEDDAVASDTGRRHYWKNDFSLFSEYSYAIDSNFRLTYIYNKLENESRNISGNYENYDKHSFRFNLNHTFNPYWSSSFSTTYIRGLYDSPNAIVGVDSDLDEYRLTAGVNTKIITHHTFGLFYSYTATDHDAQGQNDSEVHSVTLNWKYNYSPEISFDASSGVTFSDLDNGGDKWGWNGGVGMDYRFERGSVRLSANQRYDTENFTGSILDSGVKRVQEAKLNWSYQLFKETTVGSFVSYRHNRQENNGGNDLDTEKWIVGASLTQGLWKDFSTSFSYNYVDQDSDRVGDSYNEHRLSLSLNYTNELFKW